MCIFLDFEKWKVVYPAARNMQYILFYFCRFAGVIQRDRGDKGGEGATTILKFYFNFLVFFQKKFY